MWATTVGRRRPGYLEKQASTQPTLHTHYGALAWASSSSGTLGCMGVEQADAQSSAPPLLPMPSLPMHPELAASNRCPEPQATVVGH